MQVTDLQWSPDRTYFITASKDKTAKVSFNVPYREPLLTPQIISARDLQLLKTYVSDTPLNTAAITPKKDFVILGGGQAAMDVTTTSSRQGKFEARFYHKIFEDEIGRVKGHFGPLNTVAVDPQGRGYASGGEDGYVRVHHFDKGYFDFVRTFGHHWSKFTNVDCRCMKWRRSTRKGLEKTNRVPKGVLDYGMAELHLGMDYYGLETRVCGGRLSATSGCSLCMATLLV